MHSVCGALRPSSGWVVAHRREQTVWRPDQQQIAKPVVRKVEPNHRLGCRRGGDHRVPPEAAGRLAEQQEHVDPRDGGHGQVHQPDRDAADQRRDAGSL